MILPKTIMPGMDTKAAVVDGREDEIAVLHALLDVTGKGDGTVLVRGEAGIGKSTLLEATAHAARDRGMLVLTTSGVQSETRLAFAGLHQLLRPLLGHSDSLPPPQREALEAAFGIADSAAPDLFLIALATLDLLSDAGARSPLLLIAEDGQWLDRPTSDVLGFVARRLGAEPISLVISVRDGWEHPFEMLALRELRVGPLDDEVSGRILDRYVPGLEASLRARLLRQACGNPLALVELSLALDSDGDEAMAVTDYVPLTARLERAFAARLPDIPSISRKVLLVAAAGGTCAPPEVLAAAALVSERGVDVAALAPAVSAGLVSVTASEIRFRHPLVRSAVYQSASYDERLAVHAALAEALADDPDRSIWHRAAATLGADEGVASALEATALRARRRGAVPVAVSALERAAQLSAEPAEESRRLLRAAELAFEIGRADLASPLLAKVESVQLTPLEQGRLTLIRELVDPHPYEFEAATKWPQLIQAAETAAAEGDVDLALDLLWLLASRAWWKDPGAEARQAVIAAGERIDSVEGDLRVTSMVGYAAPLERGHDVIARLTCAGSEGEVEPEPMRLLAMTAIVTGAWDLAPSFLAASVASLRAHGRLGQLPRILVQRALIAAHLADWTTALPAVDEARTLALETSQPVWAAGADAVGSLVAALRGDEELAEKLAAEAERVVAPLGASLVLAQVQIARGAAALGASRHTAALEHLRRLFQPSDPAFHWTMRWWSLADLVEAALRTDNRPLAEKLVAELEPLATLTPAFWIHTALRHARALLAAETEAETLFEAALAADLGRWPFQRGRLLLAQGEWLRRQRRTADARAPLRAAREAFDAVGALSWGERARQELRASGETSRPRTPETRDRLTPQETQIAQLAAAGLTNREIGGQLYLSHRTVGSHLYRIFPKLGVSSRTQLQAMLAREASGDPTAAFADAAAT